MENCRQTEWRVTYRGGFWSQHGRNGIEIPIGKSFLWGGYVWHIPAVYVCGDGLVVDFCIEVDPEKIKFFLDKWYPILLDNPNLTGGLHRMMEEENPTSIPHFRSAVRVNSRQLREEGASSITWIPDQCTPEPMGDRLEARCVLEHYGLDGKMGWIFYRARLPWATKRKPIIRHLSLTLEQLPQLIPGPKFTTPDVGQSISAVHPITGNEHILTVTEAKQEVLEMNFPNSEMVDWPRNCMSMAYTLSPDLTKEQFLLRDTEQSDVPKLKNAPVHPSGAGSIGIIGGSDGPTAIIITQKEKPENHSAISSLHFEQVEKVLWQLEFREKLVEDISVTLI